MVNSVQSIWGWSPAVRWHLTGLYGCRVYPRQAILHPPRLTHSERQLETRRQRQALRHLAHLFLARAIRLGARIVERRGNEIFQHLLVGRHHQAVVDRHAEDAALGGGAHLDQAAARCAFDLDRFQLGLRLVHLALDGLRRFLRSRHHLFHAFHALALRVGRVWSPCGEISAAVQSISASGKAAWVALTSGWFRISSRIAASACGSSSASGGCASPSPRSTSQRRPVIEARASRSSGT